MKINHTLTKLHKGIYLLEIENSYDLAMTFCRVQEFYESSFDEIRGKNFTISQLMRLYSMKFGEGLFTYPIDWVGFNVPSKAIWNCYYEFIIEDLNEYDHLIQEIDDKIQNESPNKYYLIGSRPNEKTTIDHEVAHAFYYLNKKYKKESDKIVDSIHQSSLKKIKKHLLSIGYNDKVFKDEVQAYLSNTPEYFVENAELNKKETKNLHSAAKKINILFNETNNQGQN
jgi:hypothetical protein